jgi:hypothetical protein
VVHACNPASLVAALLAGWICVIVDIDDNNCEHEVKAPGFTGGP